MTRLDHLYSEWALAIARNDYKEAHRLKTEIEQIENELNRAIAFLWPNAVITKEP